MNWKKFLKLDRRNVIMFFAIVLLISTLPFFIRYSFRSPNPSDPLVPYELVHNPDNFYNSLKTNYGPDPKGYLIFGIPPTLSRYAINLSMLIICSLLLYLITTLGYLKFKQADKKIKIQIISLGIILFAVSSIFISDNYRALDFNEHGIYGHGYPFVFYSACSAHADSATGPICFPQFLILALIVDIIFWMLISLGIGLSMKYFFKKIKIFSL